MLRFLSARDRFAPRGAVLSPSAALLFGAIVGVIAALAVPNTASAASGCGDHYTDDMSTITNHYGVGVNPTGSTNYGMFAFNSVPLVCNWVSSVLVRDTSLGDVEVGWINGVAGVEYSHFPDDIQGCKDSGTANWSTGKEHPEAFRATLRIGSTGFRCTVFPAVTPDVGHFHTVDIRNVDRDSTWSVHLDGSNLGGGSLDMPFTSAQSWTNGERHGDETVDSSFRGLKWMNSSAGWQDWTGAMCRYPRVDPPGLADRFDSLIQTQYTWIKVTQTGSEC